MRLFGKLVVFAILPLFSAGAVVTALVATRGGHQLEAMHQEGARTELRSTEQILQDRFATYRMMLRALAAAPTLRTGDPALIVPYLREIAPDLEPEFNVLSFVDRDGVAHPSTGPAFDVTDRAYYPELLAGQEVFSPVVESRITGREVVVVMVPVRSTTGERIGAVGGSVRVDTLATALQSLNLQFGGRLVVRDREGNVLMGRELPPSLIDRLPDEPAVNFMVTDDQGDEWLVGKQRVSPVGWSMAIVRPADAVFGPIRSTTRVLAAFTVGSLLVALVAALIASRRLLGPLAELRDAFARTAEGERDVRVRTLRRDEFGDIGRWFNQTAKALEREERNLREANERLEHRVAERTAELEAFSYSLSHDLRSQLRAVSGAAAMMEEDAGDALDDEARAHLGRIQFSVRRMTQVLEGLQRLTHLTTVRAVFQEFDLTVVARRSADEISARHPERPIHLHAPHPIRVRADRDMMRLLMDNLLGNAWKFTADAGRTEVTLEAQPRDGGLEVVLSDNGIGIAPEDRERVFRPFTRTAAGRVFEGDGIGLTIVSRVVERHRGEVWADAAPGGGAAIHFRLPGGSADAGHAADAGRTDGPTPAERRASAT